MNVLPLDISFFVDALAHNEPVSFARYGDGEMYAIFKMNGENCDHCQYFPELGEALATTLRQPYDYLHGIAPKVMRHRGNGITEASVAWIEKHSRVKEWYDTEVFLTASLNGNLKPFMDELKQKHVILVGNNRLIDVPFRYDLFIEVPPVNAWLSYQDIHDRIKADLYRVDVVLFSAGMCTKVLIHDFFPMCGQTKFLLDMGSIFDMYVGIDSRSYARNLTTKQKIRLMRDNFGVNES